MLQIIKKGSVCKATFAGGECVCFFLLASGSFFSSRMIAFYLRWLENSKKEKILLYKQAYFNKMQEMQRNKCYGSLLQRLKALNLNQLLYLR